MAEPPDPREPFDDAGDAWVRPSQRRPSQPGPPGRDNPPATGDTGRAAADDTAAELPAASPSRRPRLRRDDTMADPLDNPTSYEPPTGEPPVAAGLGAAELGAPTNGAPRRARRVRHRNRRRALAGAVAALVVVAIVAALVFTGGGGSTKVAAKHRAAPVTTTTTGPAAPALAVVATTKVPSLQVFDQPVATGKVVTSLSAKTDYQQPRTLLVTNNGTPGWLQVFLPVRPNDSQGWVRSTDVITSTTDLAIKIQLSAHHLWLTKAGQPVLDTGVAVGKAQTPTPTGVFYITDPVDLQATPNGAYGIFALGLSGFSNVLTSFEGGPGQIAIHGTPYADQAGQDISNGCIRVPNLVMIQIAKTVPLGTPVTIIA